MTVSTTGGDVLRSPNRDALAAADRGDPRVGR